MAKEVEPTVTEDVEAIEEKQTPQPEPPIPETESSKTPIKLPLHPLPRPLSISSTTLTTTLKETFKRTPPKFPKFMQLPTELRLKIWTAAIEPRVHELHPCAKLYNDRMTFRSNSSKTPSIFHICHESREIALKHYQLMQHNPARSSGSGKAILRFYFCPKQDTLLLNSLMGLFVMFVLLEESEGDYSGTMKGWETVALDAERAQLISLLSGIPGHSATPRIYEVFPSLKQLIIAFDYSKSGKTRFRTSVWPGENGTSLKSLPWPVIASTQFEEIFKPMKEFLASDYKEGEVPEMSVAKVKRRPFIRGDIRYAFRKCCNFFGMRPRGVFRRI